MSNRSDIEQAVMLYFEAINSNDASLAPLSEDVVMHSPMMPEPVEGEAAVRQHISDTSPFIARMDPRMTVIEGDTAAVIMEYEGLNGVVFQGAGFLRVKNGLIFSDQVFFDTRTLIKGAS